MFFTDNININVMCNESVCNSRDCYLLLEEKQIAFREVDVLACLSSDLYACVFCLRVTFVKLPYDNSA